MNGSATRDKAASHLIMLLDAIRKRYPFVLPFAKDGRGGLGKVRVGEGAQSDGHHAWLGVPPVEDLGPALRTKREGGGAAFSTGTDVLLGSALNSHALGGELA